MKILIEFEFGIPGIGICFHAKDRVLIIAILVLTIKVMSKNK
jgi:hypothetical protein